MGSLKQYLSISSEVRKAIEQRKAVVALESDIISHIIPYPQNVEFALKLEQVIRTNGATPATIAVVNGKFKVGLTKQLIEKLAKDKNVLKVNSGGIVPVISLHNAIGATTVSATMLIAQAAGINVFSTCGIDGIYKNLKHFFDVSEDIKQISKVNMAIICSGTKTMLDPDLTIEYLETKGIPIIGYKTQNFPAFYCKDSHFQLDYTFNSPSQIANMLHVKSDLNIDGGVLIANRVPDEYALDRCYISSAVDIATNQAEQLNIKKKDLSTFIFNKIKQMTSGKSLETLIAIALNNAEVAAKIAFEFSRVIRN